MENKELENINGDYFSFRVREREWVSVLEAGYIITPDGSFVNVLDSEDHSNIFTNYIRCYMGIHNGRVFQTMEAIQELTSLGHIAYLGLKPVDMRNMMTCSESVGGMLY